MDLDVVGQQQHLDFAAVADIAGVYGLCPSSQGQFVVPYAGMRDTFQFEIFVAAVGDAVAFEPFPLAAVALGCVAAWDLAILIAVAVEAAPAPCNADWNFEFVTCEEEI